MRRKLKASRTYRKSFERYYDRKPTSYDCTNRGERKKNTETFNSRRIKSRKQTKDRNINLFAVKSVISFICVVAIFAAVNFNIGLTSDIKENIKSALSDNISYEKVENIIAKAFNKNKQEPKYSDEYNDFRIDENIIEQMNTEENVYYENSSGK